MEPEDQGRILDGTYYKLFYFLLFYRYNAKLLHTSNMELYKLQQKHSLMFYTELSSKSGVGVKFSPPER